MRNFILLFFKFINWMWTFFMLFMVIFTICLSFYLAPNEEILIPVYFVFIFLSLPSILFLVWRHKLETAAKLDEPCLNIDKYLRNRNDTM